MDDEVNEDVVKEGSVLDGILWTTQKCRHVEMFQGVSEFSKFSAGTQRKSACLIRE